MAPQAPRHAVLKKQRFNFKENNVFMAIAHVGIDIR
jgi:hypothetical protein